MKKYKLLIFDLDGTLADTSAGIYNCHIYTNTAMGRKAPSVETLEGIIGGPLPGTYINRFGFSENEAVKAVRIYREHYAVEGIKGTASYPKVCETLQQLKQRGYLLAVATLKAEYLAKDMLEKLGMACCFDLIHGVDNNDRLTKSDLIRKCINELNCNRAECVLIGDSDNDALGAESENIDFIGCTYGFGFKSESEISKFNPISFIDSFEALLEIFK